MVFRLGTDRGRSGGEQQPNADEELLTDGATDVEDSDSERKEGGDKLIVVVHDADAFVEAVEKNRTLLA